MSSITRSSSNAIGVRIRPDVIAVQTLHQNESAYVIKDPISMTYHRLRADEYFVLERLDGRCSLDDLQREYETKFHPQRVSHRQLNQLLFRFHQSGLTVSDAANQAIPLEHRGRQEQRQKWLQQLSSLLFIRFPGVDPEPFLRRTYPWIRPLLSLPAITIAAFLCVSAAIAFVTRWDTFAAEFPTIGVWLRFESLLMLAAVIGGTKVLHELGHAFVCKHFGGECHQIGPMLLVFTPALYCDTSDSWMLPNRFQRAAVGLAGVATEIVLAAAATWIWIVTAEGMVHSIAMNVMLVCGISTVVFNANPLLRYDGYYVLSDLCDTPNLAERSRRLLFAHLNRIVLGVDELPYETITAFGRFWMIAYAALATVYRWTLTLLILWFVSLMLRPYGLESIGRTLCLFAIAGMVYSLAQIPMRFLKNPVRRSQVRWGRLLRFGCTCAILAGLMMWPLPSSISTTGRFTPRKQTPVYISTPGILQRLGASPGDSVRKGDTIATLVNPDVQYEYVKALGRVEIQAALVQSLRQRRYQTPETGDELPAAEALLADLNEQLETRRERRDALVIHAAASGKLLEGSRRPTATSYGNDDAFQLVNWSGYPTDPENGKGYFQSGTELMSIVEGEDWDVEIVMSQSDVQRIAFGSKVKLALRSDPGNVFSGVVTDISRAQWTPELNTPRWDDVNATRQQAPAATSYVVRVAAKLPDSIHFRAGSTTISRIEAAPISIAGRILRSLNGLLRFR
ncbi:HlyD family efflux transporter periplasmic adaptor subunit [Novipirellula caenicola]|uniref:HlyD family secretion protein n=1 Tax=Novipirellula caenicola TaxID=1536901 RepID=A0ABP9VUT1_9BACT